MREFKGLSDFFHNATTEERQEVYAEVLRKASEQQRKVLEDYYEQVEITEDKTID